jgi:hypothetical protein
MKNAIEFAARSSHDTIGPKMAIAMLTGPHSARGMKILTRKVGKAIFEISWFIDHRRHQMTLSANLGGPFVGQFCWIDDRIYLLIPDHGFMESNALRSWTMASLT